jgi:PAS domain S-box-containing protein
VGAAPLLDQAGRAVACRMALTDVTRLKAAEAEVQRALAEERRLRERLGAIAGAHEVVSDAILGRSEGGIVRALQAMSDQARALVGAQFAAIGIDGDEGARFDPWVYSGLTPDVAAEIGSPPRPVGALGLAAHATASLRLRDVRAHAAFRGFPSRHPAMTSFLGVPIRRLGCAIGTLYVANKVGREEFTEDDEHTLQLLAERVAITLEIARLREVEAHALVWMREVLDQTPEAMVLVGDDTPGGISLNAAARSLFGGAVEVLTPEGEPIPAGDLPHVRASRGEHLVGIELRVRRPDGTLVPVIVSAAPVLDGRPGSAVSVYRDVSAMKQLEQEREEWMGVVAHDLRQPAAVISFAQQLLARYGEGLGSKEATSITRIGAAARTLSRMIDDLLDVTLIDTRRLKLKPRPVDVGALIKEVVERCRPMCEGKSLHVQAPAEPVPVLVDPERLEQVLTNLLSNAAKYSDPASEIHARLTRAGGEIEVVVENRGKGMTAEEATRVFQRFYRTRAAQAGPLGGVGLGLYIAKGLIEAHGGRIGVKSVPGDTTTFWFRLPERAPSEV